MRPRRGMLEAKDQEHRRKCSPKKILNFSRDLKKEKTVFLNFSRDLKKKTKKKSFRRSPKEENKKDLRKFSARFLAFANKILTIQKIELSSNRGKGNFRGLEASRPRRNTLPLRPRTSKMCSRGLHLCLRSDAHTVPIKV